MEIPGFKGDPAWLPARTLFLTLYGSRAYGLSTPQSDLDVRGIACAPRACVLGFVDRFEGFECKEPDVVLFELRRFMHLACECNPNVIELLYTAPGDHLGVTPAGERLIDARGGFLSRRARHTYAGFAMAQRKKLQALRRDGTQSPEANKSAMHMVRLMRMCREILETGEVRVKRPDRDELLAIRAGQWRFDELDAWAQREEQQMSEVASKSALPESPDRRALDVLCVELVEASLRDAQ